MSLKREIQNPNSPIGGFLRDVFPSSRNRALLAELHAALGAGDPICLLDPDTPPWLRSYVGQAIDYRIRHHFQPSHADPIPMARDGIWAVTCIDDLPDALRRTPERFPDYALTAHGAYSDRTGDWQHFRDHDTDEESCTVWRLPDAEPDIPTTLFSVLLHVHRPDIEPTYLPLECTLATLDLLNGTIARIAAHRRQPTPGEEVELARCCLVLSVFETVRRSGGRGWPPQFLDGALPQTAAGLLDAIPAALVADVTALAAAFTERHPTWHGAPATLNPKFAGSSDVGGADGDLIVDGCLWEIKTAVAVRARGAWLYQLLGYVLLDYEDEYAMEHAGFLFPRQNAAVHWPLTDLVRELSGRAALALPQLRLGACAVGKLTTICSGVRSFITTTYGV